jgi:hypothetical protein
MLRLPEDNVNVLKYVAVLTVYRILLIYIYIYIYLYVVHLLVLITKLKKHNATKELLFRIISLVFAEFVLGSEHN